VFSEVVGLDLKTDRESLMRTVSDSEFQTVGAENRKARLEKSLINCWSGSSGMADERKVRLQARSEIRRCIGKPALTCYGGKEKK